MTERLLAGGWEETFRRLRVWNLSSWRHADRQRHARAALAELTEMASQADGFRRPPVPDVGVHALADQLEVLSADAVAAGAPREHVEAVLVRLATQLGMR